MSPGPHVDELEDDKENIFENLSPSNKNIHPIYKADTVVEPDEVSALDLSARMKTLEGAVKEGGDKEQGKEIDKEEGKEKDDEINLPDVEGDKRFLHQISTDSDLTSFSESKMKKCLLNYCTC